MGPVSNLHFTRPHRSFSHSPRAGLGTAPWVEKDQALVSEGLSSRPSWAPALRSSCKISLENTGAGPKARLAGTSLQAANICINRETSV